MKHESLIDHVREAQQREAGCAKCGKSWPVVTFKQANIAGMLNSPPESITCDSCLAAESRVEQIAEKIDEAQGGPRSQLTRRVEVEGIQSNTNVIGFSYLTHEGIVMYRVTTLWVDFVNYKGVSTRYAYSNVPVAVCEAWYAAPSQGLSMGQYFLQFIKTSYEFEKVK